MLPLTTVVVAVAPQGLEVLDARPGRRMVDVNRVFVDLRVGGIDGRSRRVLAMNCRSMLVAFDATPSGAARPCAAGPPRQAKCACPAHFRRSSPG
jgi:hypothetical protein